MSPRTFLRDRTGASSAEMALLLPLLIVLLFGGLEAGHFVWTQHKLAEAVRDGARFASRLPHDSLCSGATVSMSTDTEGMIKLLTRTGQIASTTAMPKVPGWVDSQVEVEPHCQQFVNTGIYTDLGTSGHVVTVSAVDVPYPSLLNGLGIDSFASIDLSATSNAPVIGL